MYSLENNKARLQLRSVARLGVVTVIGRVDRAIVASLTGVSAASDRGGVVIGVSDRAGLGRGVTSVASRSVSRGSVGGANGLLAGGRIGGRGRIWLDMDVSTRGRGCVVSSGRTRLADRRGGLPARSRDARSAGSGVSGGSARLDMRGGSSRDTRGSGSVAFSVASRGLRS